MEKSEALPNKFNLFILHPWDIGNSAVKTIIVCSLYQNIPFLVQSKSSVNTECFMEAVSFSVQHINMCKFILLYPCNILGWVF